MHRTERFLARQTPFVRLLILILLVLFSTMITFFVGMLIAAVMFGADVFNILTQATGLDNPDDIVLMKYFQIVSQVGMFIIPSVLFALLITHKPVSYLWLKKFPGHLTVICAIMLIFTILPGINWLIGINETLSLPDWMQGIENWMRESEENAARLTEAFLQTTTLEGLLLNLFMVALLASVGEELLFRGVLLRLFNDMLKNAHIAVWLSAILFSMFHLQFFGFLPRLALGVIFGYMLIWSGSLWLPIIAHFINNGAAVMVYYFYNLGSTDTPAENFGNVESNLLFILSLAISAFLMFMVYTLNRKKALLPRGHYPE